MIALYYAFAAPFFAVAAGLGVMFAIGTRANLRAGKTWDGYSRASVTTRPGRALGRTIEAEHRSLTVTPADVIPTDWPTS